MRKNSKTYMGIDKDPKGAMNATGNIIRDAWLFGLIPETETCEGFTVFEFQRLDLAIMDFSEVYAEFVEAAKLPDEAATLVEIQRRIEAYYESHQP